MRLPDRHWLPKYLSSRLQAYTVNDLMIIYLLTINQRTLLISNIFDEKKKKNPDMYKEMADDSS